MDVDYDESDGFRGNINKIRNLVATYGIEGGEPGECLVAFKCKFCGTRVTVHEGTSKATGKRYWIVEKHKVSFGSNQVCEGSHLPFYRYVNKPGQRELYEPLEPGFDPSKS